MTANLCVIMSVVYRLKCQFPSSCPPSPTDETRFVYIRCCSNFCYYHSGFTRQLVFPIQLESSPHKTFRGDLPQAALFISPCIFKDNQIPIFQKLFTNRSMLFNLTDKPNKGDACIKTRPQDGSFLSSMRINFINQRRQPVHFRTVTVIVGNYRVSFTGLVQTSCGPASICDVRNIYVYHNR